MIARSVLDHGAPAFGAIHFQGEEIRSAAIRSVKLFFGVLSDDPSVDDAAAALGIGVTLAIVAFDAVISKSFGDGPYHSPI